MNFISTITAILTDQTDIKSLPNDELRPFESNHGEKTAKDISPFGKRKIARLQTLILHEHERGKMPEHGEAPMDILAMANALGIQEDSTRRIMMMESLITEIVREEIPAETERFDVIYFLKHDWNLYRYPIPERRFLD